MSQMFFFLYLMMLLDNIGFSWENTLPCQHAMTAATSTDSSALHGPGPGLYIISRAGPGLGLHIAGPGRA